MDDEHVVDNGLHVNAPPAHPEGPVQPEVNPEVQQVQQEVQAEAEVDATAGPTPTPVEELAAAKKKVIELEAEVARKKDQLEITVDALEVERRRNFADGSVRAAWDVERAELERRTDLLTRERDHTVRVYEERHRALEADLAERMKSVTPEKLTPQRLRSTWELLQRYDASVHSLSGIATATHQLVTKKYQNRRYDPVRLEGADLKTVVMRGNKAMWPPGKREAWNRINDANDLSAIRHFFPGWAPLKEADGGTIGLSPIWHQAQRQSWQRAIFLGAGRAASPRSYCAISERCHNRLAHDQHQPLAARLELVEKYRQRAERDFADRRLQLEDRGPEYHLRHRAVELLHFYLCPSLASPGTYAEYRAESYSLVRRNWQPECFNWSENLIQHLEGGTATPGQAHRRAPSPHVVISDDDEDT
ncbi:hypothetical protein R1sor_000263 [Riccia sorocarpa]|uniref:Uncharacterized protein n=1 Tax=Riccia sorocarpa TaxID=122646 RepID=A0ABD3GWT0_9MARC